jgi:hypothetical protein
MTVIHSVRDLQLRFQAWNGTFFKFQSLKSLGLHIQLGHSVGEPCTNPEVAFADDFVVVDTHGIHFIGLDFCGCESAKPHTTQLLRARWFPATVTNPKTASTFRVLEKFHLLSFESKMSVFEFYYSLVRETDNTGTEPHKVSSKYAHYIVITDFSCPGSIQVVLAYDARVASFENVEACWSQSRSSWPFGNQ